MYSNDIVWLYFSSIKIITITNLEFIRIIYFFKITITTIKIVSSVILLVENKWQFIYLWQVLWQVTMNVNTWMKPYKALGILLAKKRLKASTLFQT